MSQRPKLTMKVDRELAEKIIRLHDVEWKGFRKIGRELNLSKSRVYRIYKEYKCSFKEEIEKKFDGDNEYKSLKDTRLRLQEEVEVEKAREGERENIRKLWLRKTETQEGIRDIFSSPAKMLEFAQATVDYRSLTFKNARVFDLFTSYCQAHDLPLGETLFKAVGSLDEYEADADEDGILVDPDNWAGLQLECFLCGRREEERQDALQKTFSKVLINARCPKCGKPICSSMTHLGYPNAYTFLTIENQLRCYHCNVSLEAMCPGCGQPLGYDGQTFCCKNCNLTFHFQDSKNKS